MLTSQKTYLGIQTSIYRDGGLYISGDPQVGNTLTANNAAAVQWMADGVDISGANALTKTVLVGEVGKRITARSTSGTIETSNALTALAAVTAPTVTQPPLVVGTPTVNTPLVINAATFTGNPDKIERTIYGSAEPTAQILARGPVASTGYTPSANDATRNFVVVEEASNAAGSVRSVSPRSNWVPQESPGPVATLRQAASGTFVNETMDSTNFHAGTRLPFTAGVEIPAGTSLRVKFANKAVINNVETNGTGTFTILAASLEYNGVCTAGALGQPTATGGNLAYYDVVVPTTIPKGALFWLSYKVSDGGGMKRFPWYSHSNTNVSKMTIGTTNASVPDQTMVPGGGTWSAVTGGVQSFAIVPVAVEMVHAGKVACVGGSSSGVGRADQGAPGAGVQGYIGRAIAALGYPVKCTAVSGDRVVALAASDTYRIAQLEGVTHHILVVGGNDITDGTSAAAMLAGYQSHINHIKAAWPSIKIMVLTLTPVVTGTYDTLGGQTVVASNSVRISANTQIKANVLTGVDKVADINTLGENTFNPEDGKFPVTPGQMTNDGLHYNTLGCSTLSAHPAFAEFMAM